MTPATATAPAAAPEANDTVLRSELASLEQKLRNEIRASRAQADQNVMRTAAPATVDDATIRRVHQLIAEAEQRHSRELAARFVEFTNDLTLQRRADMQNITRAINAQDAQMFRQRQLMNNMIRVTSAPQQ
jgi:rRNA-processing protein FCF1